MGNEKWVVLGYKFLNQEEYESAKKEAESIAYIKAHTNLKDNKQLLKIYNKAVDTKMFRTTIGYEFLHQLYTLIIKNKIVEPEYIKPIPVMFKEKNKDMPEGLEEANKQVEQYKLLYENGKEEKKRLKIVIGFFFLLIVGMIAMVYFNYNIYDEDAVLDKYSQWQIELEEREARLQEREKELGIAIE